MCDNCGEPFRTRRSYIIKAAQRGGRAKLTDQQVSAIRRRYNAGGISQEKLGNEYGVTQTLIGFIVRGVIWKHLPLLKETL
jgi:hypothetical protein